VTYLEPLRKGVIEKMTYLVEFCLILERELVERALHKIFVVWILESIIKIIYPPLNFDLLYFTFSLKPSDAKGYVSPDPSNHDFTTRGFQQGSQCKLVKHEILEAPGN
jgi:hypothetical protein